MARATARTPAPSTSRPPPSKRSSPSTKPAARSCSVPPGARRIRSRPGQNPPDRPLHPPPKPRRRSNPDPRPNRPQSPPITPCHPPPQRRPWPRSSPACPTPRPRAAASWPWSISALCAGGRLHPVRPPGAARRLDLRPGARRLGLALSPRQEGPRPDGRPGRNPRPQRRLPGPQAKLNRAPGSIGNVTSDTSHSSTALSTRSRP